MRPLQLDDALYLLSVFPIMAFGLGWTFRRGGKGLSWLARLGLAYGMGALSLTVETILFAIVGIRWSLASLGLPLLAISAALLLSGRRDASAVGSRPIWSPPARIGLAIGIAAALSLALLLISSRAVSVDFLLFYGVKAARFALARGIDLGLLRDPLFYHGMPQYPALMPILEAFGALVAGRIPWRTAPLISWAWFVAAAVLLVPLLRLRIPEKAAASLAAFWTAGMALSFAVSGFGGNADGPLVFYETIAGLILLVETPESEDRRWMAAALLAGAVLTKQEGILAALLLAAGALARDLLQRRAAAFRRLTPLILLPAAALLLWFAFERFAGIRLGFHPPSQASKISFHRLPAVLAECWRNADAGSAGLTWILPAVFVLVSGRRLLASLPAFFLTLGVLAALVATYTAGAGVDLHVLVYNTFSRADQPALSLWILGAGVSWFVESSRLKSPASSKTGDPGRVDESILPPDSGARGLGATTA